MKINPYEIHPDAEQLSTKKEKNFLTKQDIFEILDKKLEEIKNDKVPRWGYDKHTLNNLLLSIRMDVENSE